MNITLIHTSFDVILTILRQLYDVVNVEEQNQLNIAQHTIQDVVDKPAKDEQK